MNTKKKVVLVTGAAGGMGQAICKKFIAEGYELAYTDLKSDPFTSTDLSNVKSAKYFPADLTDTRNVIDLVESVYETFGQVDAVVQAAGEGPVGPLLEVKSNQWQKAWDVKFMGSVRLLKEVAQKVIDLKQSASFVVISGVFSREPDPLNVVNSAINSALSGVSKAIANDFAGHNIRLNILNPGATSTQLWDQICSDLSKHMGMSSTEVNEFVINSIPLKKLAQPGDIANAAFFLACPQSSHITGTQLTVDGGATHSI
ncbi:SDR family oxidoreductase [Vibrio mediterranei]